MHKYELISKEANKDGFPVFELKRDDGKIVKAAPKLFNKIKRDGRLVEPKPAVPKAPPIPKRLKIAKTPRGFFAIQTIQGTHAQIVHPLDTEWNDLYCFVPSMNRCLHIKRRDLFPTKRVQRAIEFLKELH